MKKRLLGITTILFLVSLLSACCVDHEWQDATCTNPRTCSKCEETEGDALGHNWEEATCISPKTCSVCGETTGAVLDHEWKEATCSAAKTCLICEKTEGEPIEHVWGEWDITQEATVSEKGIRTRICAECSEKQDVRYELEVLHKEGHFIMTPNEIGARIADKVPFQKGKMYYNANGMYCGLNGVGELAGKYQTGYEDGEPIAVVMFSTDDHILGISEKDSTSVKNLTAKFFTTDSKKIVHSMLGLIMACDGSLDEDAASEVGKEIITAYENGSINYQHNGLNYVFTQKSDYYMFLITVI